MRGSSWPYAKGPVIQIRFGIFNSQYTFCFQKKNRTLSRPVLQTFGNSTVKVLPTPTWLSRLSFAPR